VLARARLTSAVELYNAAGTCVSRFALNLPEYSGTAQAPQIEAASCQWDVIGEAAPFGAEERRMLHAARQICTTPGPGEAPRVVGSIVVHVLVFDYRSLPFITSQNPYFEVFRRTEPGTTREDVRGSGVEVAIYGWSLAAVYNSPNASWSIGDDLFDRIYDTDRRPFWTTVDTNSGRYRVFFSNDRVFIYAIGYRTLTLFDHLVHLAELTTLAGVIYVLVLLGTAGFTRDLTSGAGDFATLIGEARHYFMVAPGVVLASRAQGQSSLGRDAQRFYLGGRFELRGYDRRTLAGVQTVLLQEEVRFPLLHGLVLAVPAPWLFPTIEGAVFTDVAWAWDEGFEQRLGSVGTGVYIFGGYLPALRWNFVWPTADFRNYPKGPRTQVSLGFNF